MLKHAGRYEIVAELGRGGFGQVYRAFDPTLNSMVAIKTLSIDNDAAVLARFRNEAAASRRLQHPNIVTIYDFGEQDGTPYIVMQLLEGQDLQRVIDSRKPIPLWHKIQIMTQIASGLGHAHAHDIVHRDVKPANVMLLPDGDVKIMDFGIALISQDTQNRLTPRGAVIGTFRYMAPEQFRGLPQDARGDIFAYGLMFYEMLSGVHPFHAPEAAALMYNILNLEPVPIHEVCEGCPPELHPIIARLLHKDPEFRYQNFEDVLFDCEPILSALKRERARGLFEEARAAVADHKLEAAQALLRHVMEFDASYPGARDLRERIQTELRRHAMRPRIEALTKEAREHLTSGNAAEALQKFEAAVRLDPTDITLKSSLEQARLILDQTRQVERLAADVERAIRSGDLTSAHRIAQQAAELAPSDTRALKLVSKTEAALAKQERELRLAESLARARRLVDIRSWDEAARLLDQIEREFQRTADIQTLRQTLESGRLADERKNKLASGLAAARQEIKAASLDAAQNRLRALRVEFPDAADVEQLLRFTTSEIEARTRSERVDRSVNAARELVKRNRFADASRVLQSALATYPADPVLERELRSVASLQQQSERSAALGQALDAAKAFHAQARFEEALAPLDAFFSRHGAEPAVDELRQTIERDREAAQHATELRAMVRRVNDLLSRGQAEEARQVLIQPPSALQDHPEITQLRTLTQVQLDRQEERAAALDIALAAAHALVQQNEFDQAAHRVAAFTSRYGADPRIAEFESSLQRSREEAQRRAEDVQRQAEEARSQAEQAQRQAEESRRRAGELSQMVRHADALLAEGKALEAAQLLASCPAYFKDHPEVARLRNAAEVQVRKQADREAALRSTLSTALSLERQGQFDQALSALETFRAAHGPDSRIEQREQNLKAQREQSLKVQREQALQAQRDEAQRAANAAELRELARSVRGFLAQDNPQAALALLRQAPSRIDESLELRELLQTADAHWAAQQAREAVDAIAAEARSLLSRGDLAASAAAVDAGLQRYPAAPPLQSLRAEIDAAAAVQQLDAFRTQAIAQIHSFTAMHDYERALGVLEDAQAKLPLDDQLVQLKAGLEAGHQQWAASRAEEQLQEALRRARDLLTARPAESVAILKALCAQHPQRLELAAQLAQANEVLLRAEEGALIQEVERLCGENRFAEAAARLSQAQRDTPVLRAARQQVELRRAAAENERIAQAIQTSRATAGVNPSGALAALEKIQREFPQRPELHQAIEEVRTAVRVAQRQTAIAEIQDLCAKAKFAKARTLHQKAVAQFGSDAALEELRVRIEEGAAPKLAPPKPAPAPVRAPEPVVAEASQPGRVGVWVGSGVAAAALLGAGVWFLTHRSPAPPPVRIHLAVRTDPAGATVQVGDGSCVAPNCQFDLSPGNYTITARLDGYQPIQKSLTLDPAANSRSEDLTLQPLPSAPPPGVETGTLIVQAGVPDALVYVDQAVSGRTDPRGTLQVTLEAKTHAVRVEKLGYDAPAARQIRVAKNASQTAVFTLKQQVSRLEVRGAPAGIEVRADNAILGRTNGSLFSGQVQPGDHVVRFSTGARELPAKFEPGGTVTIDWTSIAIVTPPSAPPSATPSTPPAAPPATPPAAPPSAPPATTPTVDPAERDWIPVSTSSDPKAIDDYLKAYPNSRHRTEAESRLDDAVWARVNQNDPQSLRGYEARFPKGRHAREASTRESELAWNTIDKTNEQQVRDFMGLYPESAHKADAQSLLDQMEARKRDADKQKQERAKQDELKKGQGQKPAVLAVIDQYNSAFQKRDAKLLKQIWPDASPLFLQALDSAKNNGLNLNLQNCSDPMISDGTATLSCDQVQTVQGKRSSQRFTITLRNNGGQWSIASLSALRR